MNKYKIDYEIQYDDEEGGHSDNGSIVIEAEDANSTILFGVLWAETIKTWYLTFSNFKIFSDSFITW